MNKNEGNHWWQDRAWRIVQTNLREIDMRDMDARQYVAELQKFHANTVIINTGGIVANYKTAVSCHFKNPYLTGDSLETVIAACREAGIRVVSRVDFSKVRKVIYEHHPEWAYVSPKGSIIDYFGDIHTCFNSEYQQRYAFDIMREIIRELAPDGLFMNMGGYAAGYHYTDGWQGICQCGGCRRRFFEMFGKDLPRVEDPNDPVYQDYLVFQQKTSAEYMAQIKALIAKEKPELLLFQEDMIRLEANTWIVEKERNYPFKASEQLRIEKYSYPGKVASITSVDFIDMKYRFSAVSPHQQELRMAQMLANGGFADYYLVGRLDNHPDRSGFQPLQKMFRYHEEHEHDYRAAFSRAKIALVRPSANYFSRNAAEGYFGWYDILTHQHYLFDCIESSSLSHVSFHKYQTIILPSVEDLGDEVAKKIDSFVEAGGTLIATGQSGLYDERHKPRQAPGLKSLGIQQVGHVQRDILSAYFLLEDKTEFPRFADTDYVYLYDMYCYASYADDVQKYMRLIPPHRHSPAESAYPTNLTDYPAFTVHPFGKGRGVYIPWEPGKTYYQQRFPNMEQFLDDLLENVLHLPRVDGNLPPMVEVTQTCREGEGVEYVHLVNTSGYFCGAYYEPLPMDGLWLEIPLPDMEIHSVSSMVSGQACRYEATGDSLRLHIDRLGLFEAIRIE